MKEEKITPRSGGGRFLREADRIPAQRQPGRRRRKWLAVVVLLCWDGLLLYMILRCLVDPVYGAVFVAGVSVCLGYQF